MIIHRKKYNLTYEVVKIPIYDAELIICSTDNIKNSREFWKYSDNSDVDLLNGDALSVHKSTGVYIVNFYKKMLVKDIVHESVHLTNYLYKDYGVQVSLDNDENYAYMIAFIVDKIYNFTHRIK